LLLGFASFCFDQLPGCLLAPEGRPVALLPDGGRPAAGVWEAARLRAQVALVCDAKRLCEVARRVFRSALEAAVIRVAFAGAQLTDRGD
jgi:hypothetical protein